MDLKLDGKVAAITGGSTGIGAETVKAFLREGCKVAACGRSQEKLDKLEAEVAAEGFSVLTHAADVCNMQELERFAGITADKYGGIDVWINSAGIVEFCPLIDCTEELWYKIIDTNLTGTWRGIKAAVPYMEKRGGGSIVNVSSFTSIVPTAKNGAYSISKAGVNTLTKVMAAELAPKGIRVNCIVPGYIDTEMTTEQVASIKDMLLAPISMKRLGNPGDIARGILFLAGETGRYVDGETLVISGGKCIVQNPQDPWNNYVGGY